MLKNASAISKGYYEVKKYNYPITKDNFYFGCLTEKFINGYIRFFNVILLVRFQTRQKPPDHLPMIGGFNYLSGGAEEN